MRTRSVRRHPRIARPQQRRCRRSWPKTATTCSWGRGAAGLGPALGSSVVDRTSSPVVTLSEASWDDSSPTGARTSGSRCAKYERRLARSTQSRSGLRTPNRPGDADLDTLFALHRARWPGSHWFAAAEAFHREFAAVALERGWLRLWILELAGAPAVGLATATASPGLTSSTRAGAIRRSRRSGPASSFSRTRSARPSGRVARVPAPARR